jgi:cytochrome c2
VASSASHGQAINQVDLGKQLFLAKGCATCHANRRAAQGVPFVSMGPDLTAVKLPPDYLARWLENPASIWPETSMLNLGLSVEEIQALVAFLSAPGG